MQTSVTRINAYTLSITLKDSSKEYERFFNRAIDEIGGSIRLKGFRPGVAVSTEVVLKEVGEAAVAERAINLYLQDKYPKVLSKSEFSPVAPGELKEVKSVSPVEVIFEVEVLPEITMDEKKLAKIKVKKTPVSVTEDDVDTAINEIEKRFTRYEAAAEGAKAANGDKVMIHAQGYDKKDGEAIVGTHLHDFDVVLGSNSLIPGFEDNIVGKAIGETVEFDIVFPADYHADAFKSRKVFFSVTVEKIETAKKPEWNETFIEGLRGKKTDMKGFRDIIREEIKEERSYHTRAEDEQKLLEQFIAITTVEIGPKLIAQEIDRLYREQASNMESRGVRMSQLLEHQKTDEATYKETQIKPEAERRLKAEIILKHLLDVRKPEITDAAMQAEVARVMANYSNPTVLERLKAKLVPGDDYYEDLKRKMGYRAIIDSFLE